MSETTETSGASGPRCPAWVRVLLVVSLAGNLAVLGLIGGMALREDKPRWAADPDGLDRRQVRILRLIPEARRDEARAVMLSGKAAIDAERARLEGVHGEILVSLRAPDFSPDRLGAAMSERRLISGEINEIIHAQMLTIVSDLSAAERSELADNIEAASRRWRERRGGS